MTDSGQNPPDVVPVPSTNAAALDEPEGLADTEAPAVNDTTRPEEPRRPSPKTMQPVIGYNHNARHNGRLFHLQTEDSGTRYARIITQLFMDGGRIVKSVKTSYVDHLGDPNLAEVIREMMRQQHKAMFIALRDGTFDTLIGHPSQLATAAVRRVEGAGAGAGNEGDGDEATLRTIIDPDEDPPTVRQLPDELSLDLDALDRAVQASRAGQQGFRPPSELPPPPANLLLTKPAVGLFRMAREEVQETAPAAQAEGGVAPTSIGAIEKPPERPSDRRYAAARPATIFGRPGLSFGKTTSAPPLHDDLSLDEAILRYLSDTES